MENTIRFEELNTMPKAAHKNVRSAAKTMYLTHQLSKEMADGASLEEVIAARLPMTDAEKLKEDAGQLTEGVNRMYASLGEDVTEKWVITHINSALAGLKEEARVQYMANLIALAPKESLSEEDEKRVSEIRNLEEISEEDMSFLVDTARTVITQSAGILKRSSVQAMEGVLEKLDEDTVKEFAEAGKEQAIAYAGACYILQQCGEDPWGIGKENSETQIPYTIGVTAAANTESSKLMSLYFAGKIRLEILHEKLQSLFTAAITYVQTHVLRLVAIGILTVVGVDLFKVLARYLFRALHFGPWIALIGAAALSVFIMAKVVTADTVEFGLNAIWEQIRRAWNWVKDRWNRLFADEESDHVVDTEATVDAETTEDEEEEEEIDEEEEADADEEDTQDA